MAHAPSSIDRGAAGLRRFAQLSGVLALVLVAGCQDRAVEPAAAPSPPPASEADAAADERVWRVSGGADRKLTYGVPQTDDVSIAFRCGDGGLRATFIRPREAAARLEAFELRSGEATARVPAETEPTMLGQDAVAVSGALALDHPVLAAFRQSGRLVLEVGDETTPMTATARERREAAVFLDGCMSGRAATGPT